ncbi:MAG: MFS transporter, partial [Chloroflexi bacterium]|nr:MFS transporter [Chloroflexota bacterium]
MAEVQRPCAGRYRFVIYALILTLNMVTGINFLAPAALLPLIIEDLAISRGAAGFLVTILTLVVTVATIPASIIVIRWRLKPTLGIGWLLLGAGAFAFAAPSFFGLVGLRLIQGFGAAVTAPLVAALIMRWAPAKEVPVVNAAALAALTAGLGMSFIIGPPL